MKKMFIALLLVPMLNAEVKETTKSITCDIKLITMCVESNECNSYTNQEFTNIGVAPMKPLSFVVKQVNTDGEKLYYIDEGAGFEYWPLRGNKLVRVIDGNDIKAQVDTSQLDYVYRFDLSSLRYDYELIDKKTSIKTSSAFYDCKVGSSLFD